MLASLGLKQTRQRVGILRLMLERPGLSPASLLACLQADGIPANQMTVHRVVTLFRSPAGCIARWRIVGPAWVCWGCGLAIGTVDDRTAVNGFQTNDILPLDFGGYCVECQRYLVQPGPGDPPPGLRRGRSESTFANRRVVLIPIDAFYENPTLMRDLLGSARRTFRRDYIVANLAENPRMGPELIYQSLQSEMPVVPTRRWVKQVSSLLHNPKAQILFGSLGAIGWACLACDKWGIAPDPGALSRSAPEGFAVTDVRALCASCHGAH